MSLCYSVYASYLIIIMQLVYRLVFGCVPTLLFSLTHTYLFENGLIFLCVATLLFLALHPWCYVAISYRAVLSYVLGNSNRLPEIHCMLQNLGTHSTCLCMKWMFHGRTVWNFTRNNSFPFCWVEHAWPKLTFTWHHTAKWD